MNVDPFETALTDQPAPSIDSGQADVLPLQIGRFRIERILGQGGFGVVYLGHDEQLQRKVAIKVPKPQFVQRAEDRELYLKEARTVAELEHPNIVPVLEVGSTPEFPIYVVSKFIVGTDLAARLKTELPSNHLAVQWMIDLADALREAHRKGIVHRDVKPQNVLVDQDERVYLVDFGLALRDEDVGKRLPSGGTPAYMSPEQARGEGHRVDGRSDLFSLGILFYELLCGHRPFQGNSRLELFGQISDLDPKPLRQWVDAVPQELERICLKMLAKRKSERYSSAKDLEDDLRAFLTNSPLDSRNVDSLRIRTSTQANSSDTTRPTEDVTPITAIHASDSRALKIVPKGLRSFDQRDADFFLELLPGARDRNGLPESVGFWKSRIEEHDTDQTFAVGLIYGPSGCGKSSMMKAGLLPRLSPDVVPIYLEATPDDTEKTLLAMIRKKLDSTEAESSKSLVDLLHEIRRGRILPRGKKLFIVIDQFEQWLFAHPKAAGAPLLETLLQCDGSRVQAIVMVRDDFWMAATRFFRDLDIRLVEGSNSAPVDLFGIDHAERVLKAFGRAFGKSEPGGNEDNQDVRQFISEAVRGLSEDGKVISVRIALFAEMMKDRPWTTKSLQEVGGTTGVGATFLEETFSASGAPPQHRYHQEAARSVLRALLPEAGTDIKGYKRSTDELRAVSLYETRPRDFDDLIRILDSELRLITPVDSTGVNETNSGSSTQYQLSHDYLVPSLRDWLTRKLKETSRGRTELKLSERSSLWNEKKESRYLPSLFEWLSMRTLTDSKYWTEPQRAMMSKARRLHEIRSAIAIMCAFLLIAAGVGLSRDVNERRNQAESKRLVEGLLQANTTQVSTILTSLKDYRIWADPELKRAFIEADELSDARLHAGLGILSSPASVDPAILGFLKERLLTVNPVQFGPVRSLLASQKTVLAPDYWQLAMNQQLSAPKRFHAACALAAFDPSNVNWNAPQFSKFVAEQLVTVSPTYISQYQELIRPVAGTLVAALSAIFKDSARGELARTLATTLLADFAAQDPETLVDLVLAADPASDKVLFPILQKHQAVAIRRLEAVLDRIVHPNWYDHPLNQDWIEPDAAIHASIESSQGMIAERFAFAAAMPLDKFLEVAEKLRASGYRPIRARLCVKTRGVTNTIALSLDSLLPVGERLSLSEPGLVGSNRRRLVSFHSSRVDFQTPIAVVWTRDNKRWLLETDVKRSSLPTFDMNAEKEGLLIEDLCVMSDASEIVDPTCIVLWSEPTSTKEQRRVVVDATLQEMMAANVRFSEKGIQSQQTIAVRTNSNGNRCYCGIWSNIGAPSKLRPAYAGFELHDQPQWDIAVASAGRLPDPFDKFRQQLADLTNLPIAKLDDPKLRELRATANYQLGNLDAALADLNILIEKDNSSASILQYRTLTLARLGRTDEAKDSVKTYLAADSPSSFKSYLLIQLFAWLGEYDKAWEQLQTAATDFSQDADDLYNIACASARCAMAANSTDGEQAKKFADRTFELWKQIIHLGYRNAEHLKADEDFAGLHTDPRFANLLEQFEPAPRYAALWHASVHFDSKTWMADSTSKSRQIIQQLIHQAYRPRSIAVDNSVSVGESPFKILFHLPVIQDAEKERLAREQSVAATALLRLGATERVWPLLQDQQDPRRRSYLLHRLASYGVHPQPFLNQLSSETDVPSRRSLILGLGEFARANLLTSEQHTSLVRDLVRRYSNDPDSGVHCAAEWTLRQLEATEEIEKVRAAYSTGERVGERNWYVTKTGLETGTGLTLILVQPDDFLMGSPVTEVGRIQGPTGKNEIRHIREIGRTFAIGANEVTIAQFKAFRPRHGVDTLKVHNDDSPANFITWYDAAAYCNWLSQQEGIPRDNWCYDADQKFDDGMALFPDYLKRTGYRLPSEAEWEYACRAGTTSSRYFGQTESLLGEYAWVSKNTVEERMLPVGSLRPNGAGLFDMLGNVLEWCQDRASLFETDSEKMDDKEQREKVSNANGRVLRGGSFVNAVDIRSANRVSYQPINQSFVTGFRVARTYR